MKKPFFAKFLENQISEKENDQTKGGQLIPEQTMKFPSDGDENVTLKYPSDDDEGGYQTMKYPSDNDEGLLE
ncbi:MAG: microviridin/marinostatin family tricyclic proteinase inhibitor [Marinifilaceae bacterium]